MLELVGMVMQPRSGGAFRSSDGTNPILGHLSAISVPSQWFPCHLSVVSVPSQCHLSHLGGVSVPSQSRFSDILSLVPSQWRSGA